MGRFYRVLMVLFLVILCPMQNSFADCGILFGQKAIDRYPLIFEGVVEKENNLWALMSSLNRQNESTFLVEKVYKGNIKHGDKIVIKTDNTSKNKLFKKDLRYFVFAYEDRWADGYYSSSYCTPSISYEELNKAPHIRQDHINTISMLILSDTNSTAEKITEFEKLNKMIPYAAPFYRKKADLIAKTGNYSLAIEAYKNAFKAQYLSKQNELSFRNPNREFKAYETQDGLDSDLEIVINPLWHTLFNTQEFLVPYADLMYKVSLYEEARKILNIYYETTSKPDMRAENLYEEIVRKIGAE